MTGPTVLSRRGHLTVIVDRETIGHVRHTPDGWTAQAIREGRNVGQEVTRKTRRAAIKYLTSLTSQGDSQ